MGINIAHQEQIVQHVTSGERNYFRLYPEAPSVEVVQTDNIPENMNFNEVYLYEGKGRSKKARKIETLGFRRTGKWRFGNPNIHLKAPYVAKYEKTPV